MTNETHIRPATWNDRDVCYDICLRTSDNGADGTHLHKDPDALGHIYVGPYLKFEPRFALVVEDANGVCGYCLATPDSAEFFHRYEAEWLPEIRRHTPRPAGDPAGWSLTDQLHHQLHQPGACTFFSPQLHPWPAHIHIDLLPRAQGKGWGRTLMERQMTALKKSGATGVHLCVGPDNQRALAFYAKLGFEPIPHGPDLPPDTAYLGRQF